MLDAGRWTLVLPPLSNIPRLLCYFPNVNSRMVYNKNLCPNNATRDLWVSRKQNSQVVGKGGCNFIGNVESFFPLSTSGSDCVTNITVP